MKSSVIYTLHEVNNRTANKTNLARSVLLHIALRAVAAVVQSELGLSTSDCGGHAHARLGGGSCAVLGADARGDAHKGRHCCEWLV